MNTKLVWMAVLIAFVLLSQRSQAVIGSLFMDTDAY
jgi:hypothetical protein